MIQWQERQLFVNQLSMPNFKIPQESRIGWHYTHTRQIMLEVICFCLK
ncbi:MAG: hypothetical protein HY813_02555 [Candidatus Portnoybacteria bacterium]|nr:hypothetical protein [Candidatus Portnoybacteria bacterium]